jgi:hypothetical protein
MINQTNYNPIEYWCNEILIFISLFLIVTNCFHFKVYHTQKNTTRTDSIFKHPPKRSNSSNSSKFTTPSPQEFNRKSEQQNDSTFSNISPKIINKNNIQDKLSFNTLSSQQFSNFQNAEQNTHSINSTGISCSPDSHPSHSYSHSNVNSPISSNTNSLINFSKKDTTHQVQYPPHNSTSIQNLSSNLNISSQNIFHTQPSSSNFHQPSLSSSPKSINPKQSSSSDPESMIQINETKFDKTPN